MLTRMTGVDNEWGLSNVGPEDLLIWLEPWAEEFVVSARSTVILRPSGGTQEDALGEMEWTPDHLVIWANAPTVEVYIDGVRQDSGSAVIPIPEGLTKDMLNIIFAGQPAARIGGAASEAMPRPAWWQRIFSRLGL